LALKGARPGLIKGVLKETFDVDLTRRQAAQTTQMEKLASDLIGAENLEKYKHCHSDTDWVLMYLQSTGASYMALYHWKGDNEPQLGKKRKAAAHIGDPGSSEEALLVESVNELGKLDSSQVIERSGADEITLDALDYAASTRKVVGANDTQDVLVALVWTNPRGKAYFRAFPEQASIDGTDDTTAENWDLITLTM